MLDQDEFERRLNLARERGANDLQVEALRKKYQSNVKPRDNALVGFGKAVVKPITDYGKDAIGGLYGAGAAALEIGQRLTFDPQNKSKTFDREIQRGLNFATPRGRAAMTDQSLAPTKQIGLGAQRGAGVASYLVPGGKTVGSAVKLGMASGALQGASQDNAGIGSVVSGVVGGGIGGASGYGLLRGMGKLAGPARSTGKAVSKAAGGLEKSTINPKVQPSPFAAKEEQDIVRGVVNILGKKNTAEAYREAMPSAFNKLNKQINKKLGAATVSTADVVDLINTRLEDSLDFVAGNTVQEAQKTKLMDGLIRGANNSEDALNITDTVVYEFKKDLGKRLGKVFDKVERGTPLNDKEAVTLAFWEVLDDVLTSINPAIKELTRKQSVLYKASPGLQASAKVGGKQLQVLGTNIPVPSGLGQTLKSGVARGLNATAGVIDAGSKAVDQMLPYGDRINYLAPKVGGALFSRTPQGGGNEGYNEQAYDNTEYPHVGNINPSVQPVNPFREQPTAPQQPMQPKVVMPMDAPSLIAQGVDLKKHWVVSPDGTKIWNPYTQKAMPYNKDVWQPKQKALTEKQRSYMGAAKIGQEMVDLLDTGNVATGPVAGRLDNLASKFGVQDPDQTALRSKIATARTVARNALLGANMSEQELNSYLDAMFDINQPTEILKQKLQTFIQDMNTLSATDTTGSFDLGGME